MKATIKRKEPESHTEFRSCLNAQGFAFERRDFQLSFEIGHASLGFAIANLGPDHPSTIQIRLQNARSLGCLGELTLAFQECSDIVSSTQSSNDLALALEARGSIHAESRNWPKAQKDFEEATDLLDLDKSRGVAEIECEARCALQLGYTAYVQGNGNSATYFLNACDLCQGLPGSDLTHLFRRVLSHLPNHDEVPRYLVANTAHLSHGEGRVLIPNKRSLLTACAETCLHRNQMDAAENLAVLAFSVFELPANIPSSALIELGYQYLRQDRREFATTIFRSVRSNCIGESPTHKILRAHATIGISKILSAREDFDASLEQGVSGLLELEDGLRDSGQNTEQQLNELVARSFTLTKLGKTKLAEDIEERLRVRGIPI